MSALRQGKLDWFGIAVIAICLSAVTVPVQATPIRPDLQRLLAEPQTPSQFVPARAGWHGPETPAPVARNVLQSGASPNAVRASLMAAAIPDPWAVLAIAAAILLLRWTRLKGGRQQLRPDVTQEALPEIKRAA